MTFTPTPEAVEAVVKALKRRKKEQTFSGLADDAIAAFVEAEGLIIETHSTEPSLKRPCGPWRKRD